MADLYDLPLFAQPIRESDPSPFSGPHEPEDVPRFGAQLAAVRDFMASGEWVTLTQIAAAAKCTTQSASARVRDMRKPRWGSHVVERRKIPTTNVYQYRLVLGGNNQ
jgi:hypothetical protein